MKRSVGSIVLSVAAALSLSSSAAADNIDCGLAASTYHSTIELVGHYLKDYSACVASTHGKDDCGREFRRLGVAQSQFEPAVSKVQANCRRLPWPYDQ